MASSQGEVGHILPLAGEAQGTTGLVPETEIDLLAVRNLEEHASMERLVGVVAVVMVVGKDRTVGTVDLDDEIVGVVEVVAVDSFAGAYFACSPQSLSVKAAAGLLDRYCDS